MLTRRTQFEILNAELENERSSFIAHWRDLNDYIFPRRARFETTDINRGEKRNYKIIDSTATLAARTLRSGLMGGITSPARPWFRLTTSDPQYAEVGNVKNWLHQVNQRMITVFLKSNLYNVLPILYGDIGIFGTGAIYMEEDFKDVIRFYSLPIASYSIGLNQRGNVDVIVRTFQMTIRQIVDMFAKRIGNEIDWSNISEYVKNHYDNHHYELYVEVRHVIRPNPNHDPRKLSAKFKKYESVYYETGNTPTRGMGNYMNNVDDLFLRESGYDLFPVLCPRWEVTGEDTYGTKCPAMDCLGDIKQLQLQEKRIAQGIEKIINPPMTGPTSLKTQKASILPGDITYVDAREGQTGFRTAHEVRISIAEIEAKQQQIRQRISRCFYEDLFLMMANEDRRQITATEIAERKEEKLLALGPMLEQLNQDLLDPLIDNTFEIMARQGLVPTPPDELQGMDLKVEYISIMAQAQKLVGLGGIERFTGYVGNLVQAKPDILDKVDIDQLVDTYGDITSVPPDIIRSDEDVEKIRAERQAAIAQQQRMDSMQQAGGMAKDLSQAKIEDGNALNALLTGAAGAGGA